MRLSGVSKVIVLGRSGHMSFVDQMDAFLPRRVGPSSTLNEAGAPKLRAARSNFCGGELQRDLATRPHDRTNSTAVNGEFFPLGPSRPQDPPVMRRFGAAPLFHGRPRPAPRCGHTAPFGDGPQEAAGSLTSRATGNRVFVPRGAVSAATTAQDLSVGGLEVYPSLEMFTAKTVFSEIVVPHR